MTFVINSVVMRFRHGAYAVSYLGHLIG